MYKSTKTENKYITEIKTIIKSCFYMSFLLLTNIAVMNCLLVLHSL